MAILKATRYVPTVEMFKIWDRFGIIVNADGTIVGEPNDCTTTMGAPWFQLSDAEKVTYTNDLERRAIEAGIVDHAHAAWMQKVEDDNRALGMID